MIHREQVRDTNRLWRERNKDKVQKDGLAYREKHREYLKHQTRLYYWADPEKSRMRDRSYKAAAKAKGKQVFRYDKGRSLDEPINRFGSGHVLSRLDRTPDTRVLSPETAALEAPIRQAVRAFVEEALTSNERLILEAFADCGFSTEGTAELLEITADEVQATMAAIRARAAVMALDDAEDDEEKGGRR
ncbi:MAG: hypothetical protein ACRYFS_17365 [Janthinobacterium lividum]